MAFGRLNTLLGPLVAVVIDALVVSSRPDGAAMEALPSSCDSMTDINSFFYFIPIRSIRYFRGYSDHC
jgi:prepilin signal peptidase PulO-like enzyme (type II secretory pathway)